MIIVVRQKNSKRKLDLIRNEEDNAQDAKKHRDTGASRQVVCHSKTEKASEKRKKIQMFIKGAHAQSGISNPCCSH